MKKLLVFVLLLGAFAVFSNAAATCDDVVTSQITTVNIEGALADVAVFTSDRAAAFEIPEKGVSNSKFYVLLKDYSITGFNYYASTVYIYKDGKYTLGPKDNLNTIIYTCSNGEKSFWSYRIVSNTLKLAPVRSANSATTPPSNYGKYLRMYSSARVFLPYDTTAVPSGQGNSIDFLLKRNVNFNQGTLFFYSGTAKAYYAGSEKRFRVETPESDSLGSACTALDNEFEASLFVPGNELTAPNGVYFKIGSVDYRNKKLTITLKDSSGEENFTLRENKEYDYKGVKLKVCRIKQYRKVTPYAELRFATGSSTSCVQLENEFSHSELSEFEAVSDPSSKIRAVVSLVYPSIPANTIPKKGDAILRGWATFSLQDSKGASLGKLDVEVGETKTLNGIQIKLCSIIAQGGGDYSVDARFAYHGSGGTGTALVKGWNKIIPTKTVYWNVAQQGCITLSGPYYKKSTTSVSSSAVASPAASAATSYYWERSTRLTKGLTYYVKTAAACSIDFTKTSNEEQPPYK